MDVNSHTNLARLTLTLRPPVKSVALAADALREGAALVQIVPNALFEGGTTVVAAELTGRRCYRLECGPARVDTTIRRWHALSGATGRHDGCYRSFDDLTCEAEVTNVR